MISPENTIDRNRTNRVLASGADCARGRLGLGMLSTVFGDPNAHGIKGDIKRAAICMRWQTDQRHRYCSALRSTGIARVVSSRAAPMRTGPVRVRHARPHISADDDVCSTVRHMARVITCTIDKVPRDDDRLRIRSTGVARIVCSRAVPIAHQTGYCRVGHA